MPKRGWEVYVFQADFNSIVPDVKSELTSLGFKEGRRLSADPNEVGIFSKTYAGGSGHHIEIYKKRLGSVGEAASAQGWVSVSSHDDHYFGRRIRKFVGGIRRLILRNRKT